MPVQEAAFTWPSWLCDRDDADTAALHAYALVDPAQDKRLPSVLHAPRNACLLGDDASIREASPHLVELPDDNGSRAWNWLARNGSLRPCAVLVTSELDFDALFGHLLKFLDVQINRSTTMLLAWWDPSILASLLGQLDDATLYVKGPIFTAEQRAAFVEPLSDIGYWNRAGSLCHVATGRLSEAVPAMPGDGCDPVLPLAFDARQVRELVRAATPDQVLYELRLNRPGVLSDRNDGENYRMACRLVDAAERYAIRGLRDLVNFVGAGMILGEHFHLFPAIARELEAVTAGRRSFTDMLSSLPPEALTQARQDVLSGAAE
jgi:hypothetical protein